MKKSFFEAWRALLKCTLGARTSARRVLGAFLIALVCTFSGIPAHATSFDCAKATSAKDQLICKNAQLSKDDDQLAVAYHTAMASISFERAQELRHVELSWLKGIGNLCPVLPGQQNLAVSCLDAVYTDRTEYLHEIINHQANLSDQADATAQVISDGLKTQVSLFPTKTWRNLTSGIIDHGMLTSPTEITYTSASEFLRKLPAPPDEYLRMKVREFLTVPSYAGNSDEVGHAFQNEAGHLFRTEAGRCSDLKPAT